MLTFAATCFFRHQRRAKTIAKGCPPIRRALLAIAALLLAGCRGRQMEHPPPSPPVVTVSKPAASEVTDWDEYAGRLQSPKVANVTARVSGFVENVPFDEGALVHQGDVLCIIDERPFKADFENKRAVVQKDEAQIALTDVQLSRSTDLLKQKVISQQEFDTIKAQSRQSIAQLAADKAAEETARLNLEWTRVTAPIAGRISRRYVTAGNQVNSSTLLTTIVSVDPMYCYVSVPGRAFLQYQQLAKKHEYSSVRRETIPCYVGLENEDGFPHDGAIDFIDNAVDANTGTIQMRGVIPNPAGTLTPGTFARMRIPRGESYKALLIPDQAIGAEQTERYLLVVGEDNLVVSRTVKVGALFGSLRAITGGLNPTDRVVVNGMQKVMPGEKVAAQEVPISDATLRVVKSQTQLGGPPKTEAARP